MAIPADGKANKDGERRSSREVATMVALRGRVRRFRAGPPLLDETPIAGAGSSKSCLSLARDGGAPKLPYPIPLAGVRASPDRSSSEPAFLLCRVAVDPDRSIPGSSPRLPVRVSVVLRGGVKLCLMPKTLPGVVAGAASGLLVIVGVALARLMARVTTLTCFLPAL